MRKRIGITLIACGLVFVLLDRRSGLGSRRKMFYVSRSVLSLGECQTLTRCAPGCYRGKPYCLGICTANVGQSSCWDECMGDDICAMPGYDPIRAFEALTQKQRNDISARANFLFGHSSPISKNLGEGLNPALSK